MLKKIDSLIRREVKTNEEVSKKGQGVYGQ
jgi:hypothetical protein